MAKQRYNYIRKKLAPGSIKAIVTMLISFLLLVADIAISVIYRGEGPLLIGAIGISSIFLDISSLYISVQSLQYREDDRRLIILSFIVASIMFFIWLLFIFIGLRL